MRARNGERVLGPYEEDDGWRVIRLDDKEKRSSRKFSTLRAAEIYAESLRGELVDLTTTTHSAIVKYREHLRTKGNKPDSVRQTCWAIEQFFLDDVPLAAITPKRGQKLYDDLRERPTKDRKTGERTGPPMSTDSHRGVLAQAKTFLVWCRKQGWIKGENPLAEVQGVGKRRPRGKSLGASGNELRVKQARAWYRVALELADGGDSGAVAALVALHLGLRASEIVSRRVVDLDDDEAEGDLLWIPDSKTLAGRRTLEVPEALRPLLLAQAEGKAQDRYLFECEREQDPIGKPHARDWVIDQVHRICDEAKVPRVTAHALRGLLATLAAERGIAGKLIAATLGHEDERTTMTAYARPGSAASGARKAGLKVLNGGVQVRPKSAK